MKVYLHTDTGYIPDQWYKKFEQLLKEQYKIPYKKIDLRTVQPKNGASLCFAKNTILSDYEYGDFFIGRLGHSPDELARIKPIYEELNQMFSGRIYPCSSSYYYYNDKFRQTILFQERMYPTPKKRIVQSRKEVLEFIEANDLSFPLVQKKSYGAGSSEVKLIDNFPQKVSERVLVEEFCPGNEKDYRIIVIGDRVMGFTRLVPKGDFRASGSGKNSYVEELPKEAVSLCYRISKELGFDSMMYDLIWSDGKLVVLEMSYTAVDFCIAETKYFYDMSSSMEKKEKEGVYPQEFILGDLFKKFGLKGKFC